MNFISFNDHIVKEKINQFSGSEKKKTVVLDDGKTYLLKFPDPSRQANSTLSYINNALSEYIGCKIVESIGIPVLKRPVHIRDYDAEYEHPTKYTSGRASYVERNQAMINDSDFFVFYFDETYKPPRRKYGKHYLTDYQPKSGTAVAYAYALQKKKQIYNLCEKQCYFVVFFLRR